MAGTERSTTGEKREHFEKTLGDIAGGLGSLFDLVSRLSEKAETMSGDVTSKDGKVRGVYGVSIHSGLGGAPKVSSFGNIKKTSKGPVVEETREPMTDLFDEEENLVVIAELPGVGEGDITLELDKDVLTLSASNRDRKYFKNISLNRSFSKEQMSSAYKNGVLTVTFSKK